MLRLDVLPDNTRALFEYPRADTQFQGLKMSQRNRAVVQSLRGDVDITQSTQVKESLKKLQFMHEST